jgi:hypothetical protein
VVDLETPPQLLPSRRRRAGDGATGPSGGIEISSFKGLFVGEGDGQGSLDCLLLGGDLDHGTLEVIPGLGFHHASQLCPVDATEAPVLDGDALHQELLHGDTGLEVMAEGSEEPSYSSGFSLDLAGGDDEPDGVHAMFEGIEAGAGLAFGGFGAGAELGVAAVGCDLFVGGHEVGALLVVG